MPLVALVVIAVAAGCGTALLVVSRRRSEAPPPGRRRIKRRRIVDPDPDDGSDTWQFAAWAGQNAVASAIAASDGQSQDDTACRVDSDNAADFDVERDDSCSSDSSDSSDSGSDSGGDSGSSD